GRPPAGRTCLRAAAVGRDQSKWWQRFRAHTWRSKKFYNEARTHLSLLTDAPIPGAVQTVGQMLAMPMVSGLHAPSDWPSRLEQAADHRSSIFVSGWNQPINLTI